MKKKHKTKNRMKYWLLAFAHCVLCGNDKVEKKYFRSS